MSLRLLIIEDEPVIRAGLMNLCAPKSGELTVVGAVASVLAAKQAIARGLAFELALVDLGLPDGSGVELISLLRDERPQVISLVFTQFDDAASVFSALKAGACGYLLKDTAPERIVAALLEAATGGSPMSPAVARMVIQSFSRPPEGAQDYALTPREKEVLQCLVDGLSYPQIASALCVGLGTIQNYIKTIYRKLHVSTKAEAAAIAVKSGLV